MKKTICFYDMILDEEQAAFVDAIKDPSKTIIFCDAPAGTGKTTLAMGAANLLVQDKRNKLDGIVYIVSPYGEGKQGYLPGSITEKSEVYYEPAYQAMIEVCMNPYTDVCSKTMTEKRKPNDGIVNLLTHTYLRGTNLQNKVVILDESQNYTVAELKKVLTRCHDSCYEEFGRTMMVRFKCQRCKKTEYRPLKDCLPSDCPVRNLSDLEAPTGWRDGGFYHPTFCPECAEKYKRFMDGEDLA